MAAAILMLVAFAGCVEEDPSELDPPSEQQGPRDCEGEPLTSPSTGAIDGRISSNLFEPLEGARLILWDEQRTEQLEEVRATQEGRFVFCELEPARYAVQGLHDGYETDVRGVDVKAETVASTHLKLAPLPTTDPYVIEEDVDGMLEWAYTYRVEVPTQGCTTDLMVENVSTCGGSRSAYSENFRDTFDYVDNESMTIHLEMVWDSAGALGEQLRLVLFCDEWTDDRSTPCYYEGDSMTSPIVIRTDREEWDDFNFTKRWHWHVFAGYGMLGTYPLVGADVGVAYQQEYTVYVSVFQRERAPEGFSRVPES